MTPCEALLDVLLRLQVLHELDNLEIGHIDLRVLAAPRGFCSQEEEGGEWVVAVATEGWGVIKYLHLDWMDDMTNGWMEKAS